MSRDTKDTQLFPPSQITTSPTKRSGSHSVHGASNFAALFKGQKPSPLIPSASPTLPSCSSPDTPLGDRRFQLSPGDKTSMSVHGASNFASMMPAFSMEPSRWIHFVRHCEGEHNAAKAAGSTSAYLLADALLSQSGEEHARRLSRHAAFFNAASPGQYETPDLVVCSPLRRTLQTAMLAFGGSSVPTLCRPELQETSLTPCDTASPELGAQLLAEMGWTDLLAEYHSQPEDWHIKGSEWRTTVRERFRELLAFLETREEKSIAVVSHHDFLKANLGVSLTPGEVRTYGFEGGKLIGANGGKEPSPGSQSARSSLGLRNLSGMRLSSLRGSRKDKPGEDSVSSVSSFTSPARSADATPTASPGGSPGPSRNSSRNDLTSYFKGATSLLVRVPKRMAGGSQEGSVTKGEMWQFGHEGGEVKVEGGEAKVPADSREGSVTAGEMWQLGNRSEAKSPKSPLKSPGTLGLGEIPHLY